MNSCKSASQQHNQVTVVVLEHKMDAFFNHNDLEHCDIVLQEQ